ncbi:MAG: alpha/beta fold hydrolase [Gammaproteobacteria bacterium]|nr:alpha/beta fold hydrolase [Gammaproteobacteria bacterium]
MQLHFREYGSYSDRRPTLIFLHGLFGAASNWHSIARRLEPRFHIIVPDLRNHGRSAHDERMDYPAMAADVAALIDEHGLDSALPIGHSMGGKAAMWLALQRPELVAALVVVDIAPVTYDHRHDAIFSALQGLPLATLTGREEAARLLLDRLGDQGLVQYLLQNLVRHEQRWRWRLNLAVLARRIDTLTAFPEVDADESYAGRTLFVHGAASDYLKPQYRARIDALFPHARLRVIPGAGHWVYAEQPDVFFSVLNRFLES